MILLCVTLIVIKEFREQTKYICKFDGACIDDMYIPRLLLFIKCMCSDVSIFLEQIHGENSASSLLNMIQCSTKSFILMMYIHHKYPGIILQETISQKKLKLSVKSAFRRIIRSNGNRWCFLCHITNYIRRLKTLKYTLLETK